MTTGERPAYAFTGAVAAVAVLVTAVVGLLPFLRYAYEAPALHVALETANSIIAMIVGFLVYGRFRRNGRLQELLLVCSLAVVAVTNLLLTAIPTALELAGGVELSSWAPVVVRFVATVLLVAAAFTPPAVRVSGRRLGPVPARCGSAHHRDRGLGSAPRWRAAVAGRPQHGAERRDAAHRDRPPGAAGGVRAGQLLAVPLALQRFRVRG